MVGAPTRTLRAAPAFLVVTALILWTLFAGANAYAQLNGSGKGSASAAKAWGYFQGEMLRLDRIERAYPDLQDLVFVARSELNAAFPNVVANFERSFAQWGMKDSDVAEVQQRWAETIRPMIDREPADRESVRRFIESVRQRATGVGIPEEVLQYLLAASFMDKPEMEFARGWRLDYKSGNHPKAKGVSIVLKTPRSFKHQESERPNILAKWTSEAGNGLEMLMLEVSAIDDRVPSRRDIEEDLRKGDRSLIRKSLTETGKILAVRAFSQELASGYIADIESDGERAGLEFTIRQRQFVLFVPGRAVTFSCLVEARNNPLALDAKMRRIGELCRFVANSLVLPQQYPGGK